MNDRFSTLHLGYTSQSSQDAGRLGVIAYGRSSAPASPWHVPLAVLPSGQIETVWYAPGPIAEDRYQDIRFRHNDTMLCGYLRFSEQDFENGAGQALEQIGRLAYTQIFELLQARDFPHLVRCWNYMPRINAHDTALERYRVFNIGRQDAFIAAAQSHEVGAPAASALGTPDGDVIVYFLASRIAAQALENPRQVSAYRYPAQYGPRSPTFSRGGLLSFPSQNVLFISGTASIVGHDSVHIGDVRAQTEEIIRNLSAVSEQARLAPGHPAFNFRDLHLKIFVRHTEDYPLVAQVLSEARGHADNMLYVQADICRSELLIEIEAFGVHERGHT